MSIQRNEAFNKLLKSFKSFYNITLFENEDVLYSARCDFFQHSQKYVLSKKAELWSADCEEFVYIFNIPRLTKEILLKCQQCAYEDGMSRLNIGPGHMYSYITAIYLCDSCDEDARKQLKKTRIYKSFHFSLHGWMDYHTSVVSFDTGRIDSNSSGKSSSGKILKKILFNKKEKEK